MPKQLKAEIEGNEREKNAQVQRLERNSTFASKEILQSDSRNHNSKASTQTRAMIFPLKHHCQCHRDISSRRKVCRLVLVGRPSRSMTKSVLTKASVMTTPTHCWHRRHKALQSPFFESHEKEKRANNEMSLFTSEDHLHSRITLRLHFLRKIFSAYLFRLIAPWMREKRKEWAIYPNLLSSSRLGSELARVKCESPALLADPISSFAAALRCNVRRWSFTSEFRFVLSNEN